MPRASLAARGMDPRQLPRDPEPGLIEMRDRRGGDLAADRLQRPAERRDDPPGHGGDRRRRDADAEQLREDLPGPEPGQELPYARTARTPSSIESCRVSVPIN